ncbi:winged helix-turn-helix transcriptional regulator [Actinomadura syzygii]|uniref:Helix-turn-helix transcriptional regulator n=1 Tax=Actinomadura syzygii TaxID=1427538 RepID=A0A5D0U5J7_9ACTN|nr:helix-turn-helix domain-containing protein [Actinomadura syzygii]TYC13234.1 helix-turn-helix transcriptional regulator [Actinomadura syzygii]
MAHQTVSDAATELLDSCQGPVVEPDPSCPVEITLAALRGRWTALVLLELLHGPRSFSQLAQALPTLSDKVLTDRLGQLVEAGALDRHRTPGWPPRVRYVLTDRGRALAPVLQALWDWGSNTTPAQAR